MHGRRATVVDLFSGAGGFSLGLHAAGARIAAAVDASEPASATFRHNFGELQPDDPPLVLGGDEGRIEHIDLASVARAPDVVIGGPPCQGFSRVGRAKLASLTDNPDELDPRNELYLRFVDAIRLWRPRAFIMENVPGMLSLRGTNVADTIGAELASCGYRVGYVLRPDYFLKLDDTGILLEVERGKTTINNMDLLDFWKCHLCRNTAKLRNDSSFLAALLDGDARIFLDRARLDVIIAGTVCLLEDELAATRLRVATRDGALADLVRPEHLPVYHASWHTRFATGSELDAAPEAAICVLDGVRHFTRNIHAARGLDWVAIVERSHPRFDDACKRFNELRMSRVETASGPSLAQPPPGIEVSWFDEGQAT